MIDTSIQQNNAQAAFYFSKYKFMNFIRIKDIDCLTFLSGWLISMYHILGNVALFFLTHHSISIPERREQQPAAAIVLRGVDISDANS